MPNVDSSFWLAACAMSTANVSIPSLVPHLGPHYLDGCVVDLCARANFCAWAMCAGVTRVAISSRAPAAYSSFLRFRTAVSLTDTARRPLVRQPVRSSSGANGDWRSRCSGIAVALN
jgi:hypothetical protein